MALGAFGIMFTTYGYLAEATLMAVSVLSLFSFSIGSGLRHITDRVGSVQTEPTLSVMCIKCVADLKLSRKRAKI